MTPEPNDAFRSRRAYRLDRMRKGQQLACLAVEKGVIAGKQFISIVLPTRYGKTHVIRATAGQLVHHGHACCALVLSPNTILRDQVTDPRKIQGFMDLLQPTFDFAGKTYTIKSPVIDPGSNGEWLLSANIHLFQRNLDFFGSWVESKVTRSNKTLLVYIDEAHTGSVSNKWGEVASVLARFGATIILLTATPYRSDGDSIRGFKTIVLNEEEYSKTVPSEGSSPELVKISVFEGFKRVIRLEADYEYPLKMAWDENPLPIAKVEWLPFAVNVEEITKGETKFLSDLKPNVVRGILGRVVRDPLVIENGVRLMVSKLRELKRKDPAICAIVFCGNDKEDDPENNAHASLIGGMLKMVAPDLRVLISTCASDEDDDDAMTRYLNGDGDVIIVKQRGSVGIDVERLKVALDLSSVRTRAAFYQRMMRIATLYRGFYGILICPDDPIGSAHFQTIVSFNGGEMVVSDLEKVNEYEVPKKDQPEKDFYSVKGTDNADFGDSDQNWADKSLMIKVEAFRQLFPEVVGMLSHAQIAARIEESHLDLQIPTRQDSRDYDTNLRIFTLRKSIVGKVSEIVGRDRKARHVDKEGDEPYSTTIRNWYKRLYNVASVTFVPIDKQNNIATLERLDKVATQLLASICSGAFDDEE